MGTTMKLLATILAVAFSSPADFLINTRDTQCTNKGGQCLDWRYYVCTAGYSSGLCNGDNNRKCCNKCDNSCVSQENQDKRGDGKCDDMGGKCMHNTNYCADLALWKMWRRQCSTMLRKGGIQRRKRKMQSSNILVNICEGIQRTQSSG